MQGGNLCSYQSCNDKKQSPIDIVADLESDDSFAEETIPLSLSGYDKVRTQERGFRDTLLLSTFL